MSKLTVEEQIKARKIKKPGGIYNLLGWVWKTFMYKKYNAHVNYKTDIRKEKRQFIMISNHASRLDYMYTGIPTLPHRMNFVAGYNEFYRSHLSGVFKLLCVIPKKNFTPDSYTIKEVSRVIKAGGNVMLFPEGMSSISGANQPVALGTGKFLKHYKLPVYASVIKGGYLTSPKYNLRDRTGTIEVDVDLLFTPEQLEIMTPEEIEDKVNSAIYHDDYKWNLEKKYHYDIGENGAESLEDLLYWCPKCGKQHVMATKGNTIYCTECGNGAAIDDTYAMTPLNDGCVIPATQTEWFNMEREMIKREIADPDYSFSVHVKLGMLPQHEMLKNQATSQIVGEGEVTVDRSGFSYKGTKDGEPFEFHIPIKNVPTYGMCTDVSRFYTFYNGQFVEFYPDKRVVEKIFMVTEELHRLCGGKWQDFKFEK